MRHQVFRELPLVLDAVSLRAGSVAILDHVELAIEAGAPTLVIGPNGSGKTSLLHVAMGLTAPTEGRVLWGGRLAAPPVRRALVFQRPVMLRRSVLANVTFALARAGCPWGQRRPRAEALLERVGLADLAGRAAPALSGGEKQRLALARALAREPELLLLDEPTANLDPASARRVEAIVGEAAAAGVKIILATHDLGQARRLAGEVVFMTRGRVRERAAAPAFFAAPATPEARAFLAGDIVL
ncbi:energy-coupling factor ABC transporter ATP-binding protein [Antarcticirhabdus aurantiaca]|uniref:ATP-binding cassette domain-containing protein n=1 Tax=Antarcticirhabdus aurantiaca TaxID=2606717 RepID=A0ACD4NUQ6_9HYPH|nr:ATP-binding cassette domain-containing protein [Antarcticirhabdus aurantiaca]WAJ30790.1 ATP-binding cassette domain-containing protein [Jeongeuplla avenae]